MKNILHVSRGDSRGRRLEIRIELQLHPTDPKSVQRVAQVLVRSVFRSAIETVELLFSRNLRHGPAVLELEHGVLGVACGNCGEQHRRTEWNCCLEAVLSFAEAAAHADNVRAHVINTAAQLRQLRSIVATPTDERTLIHEAAR